MRFSTVILSVVLPLALGAPLAPLVAPADNNQDWDYGPLAPSIIRTGASGTVNLAPATDAVPTVPGASGVVPTGGLGDAAAQVVVILEGIILTLKNAVALLNGTTTVPTGLPVPALPVPVPALPVPVPALPVPVPALPSLPVPAPALPALPLQQA